MSQTKYHCSVDVDLFRDIDKNVALRIRQHRPGYYVGVRSFYDKMSEEELHNKIATAIADVFDLGGLMSAVEYNAWELGLGDDPTMRIYSDNYYINFYHGLRNSVLDYLRNNSLEKQHFLTMKVEWTAEPHGRLGGWIRDLGKVVFDLRSPIV